MSNSSPSACYPYFKLRRMKAGSKPAAAGATWTVPALCAAYNWPTGLNGGGVIAIGTAIALSPRLRRRVRPPRDVRRVEPVEGQPHRQEPEKVTV